MTVKELIKILQSKNQDMEVMILDGSNGGGTPRTLNLGPTHRFITEGNNKESSDCENRIGEPIVVIGFGCY